MWISFKKWNEWRRLEELAKFIEEINSDEEGTFSYWNMTIMHDKKYVRLLTEMSILGEKAKDADTYKKLYLDEMQKRLELADRVRELEGE